MNHLPRVVLGPNDAWFSAMAGQPADDPHRPYAGAYLLVMPGHRAPASGHRLALPLADGAPRGRHGHRGGGRRHAFVAQQMAGPRRRVNWQPLGDLSYRQRPGERQAGIY